MANMVKYGVGEQSFKVLREGGFLYVDKTQYIEKIVNGSQYYFLGRPRRFGKSLFLSTLKFFFEGRRELFKGLHADSMDWNWEPHPVLHIALNTWDYSKPGNLNEAFNAHLRKWEKEYEIKPSTDEISSRFREVIERAYELTGKRVVILVDEYDNPLVDTLDNKELFEDYRAQLSAIYSNFKSSADYIRLVFLTGVSRFGKVSIFSGLNNIKDISFWDAFSGVCGITESELLTNFKEGISDFAEARGKTYDKTVALLKKWYDGYHFSANCPDIYNPFSILNFMDRQRLSNFWITSGGIPTILMKSLSRCNEDLSSVFTSKCSEERLLGIDFYQSDPLPLLYQTGYLTIKNYNLRSGLITLGLPNNEVKKGFLNFLLPYYASLGKTEPAILTEVLTEDLEAGNAEGFMKRLQSLFAGYSYEMKLENENNFHNVIYMLMLLIGINVQTEHKTSDGRIDLLITTDKYRYVIELKIDSTPEAALRQIEAKGYPLQFNADGRTIIMVGANFSTETRRLTGYLIKSMP